MIPIRLIRPERFKGTNDVAESRLIWQYYKSEYYLNDPKTMNHENTHWRQGIVSLGLNMLIQAIIKMLNKRKGIDTYWNDPYEEEAYDHEDNPNYWPTPVSWVKYTKNKVTKTQ